MEAKPLKQKYGFNQCWANLLARGPHSEVEFFAGRIIVISKKISLPGLRSRSRNIYPGVYIRLRLLASDIF